MRKKTTKKEKVPDYGIDIEDEVEDMNLGDLFDEQPIPPQQEKQIAQIPPTYEESLADILKEKNPLDPQDPPPEYDDDEEIDYTIHTYTGGVL